MESALLIVVNMSNFCHMLTYFICAPHAHADVGNMNMNMNMHCTAIFGKARRSSICKLCLTDLTDVIPWEANAQKRVYATDEIES